MKYFIQKMPKISVNDETILLVSWLKKDGDFVKEDEPICDVESSKEVTVVLSERNGYFFKLVEEEEMVEINKPIAVVSEDQDLNIDSLKSEIIHKRETKNINSKKYTKKAKLLSQKYNISLDDILPVGEIVQESDIENHIEKRKHEEAIDLVEEIYPGDAERVLILGGGKSAIMVMDIILNNKFQKIAGILDDNKEYHGKKLFGYEIQGPIALIDDLMIQQSFDSVIISFSKPIEARSKLYMQLSQKGVKFANIIDDSVIIHRNVKLGRGNIVFAYSRIGVCSKIGNNNFISSYTNIEHHNILGNNCTFGPFVSTSGSVEIGDEVKFGTGILIEPGLKIGQESIISSGCVITNDIQQKSIVKKSQNLRIKKII